MESKIRLHLQPGVRLFNSTRDVTVFDANENIEEGVGEESEVGGNT